VNPQLLFYIVSLVTASLILVLGIVILVGLLLPEYVPVNYRVTLGIIMIVYGIYRTIMAVLKIKKVRQPRHYDEKI